MTNRNLPKSLVRVPFELSFSCFLSCLLLLIEMKCCTIRYGSERYADSLTLKIDFSNCIYQNNFIVWYIRDIVYTVQRLISFFFFGCPPCEINGTIPVDFRVCVCICIKQIDYNYAIYVLRSFIIIFFF